MSKIEASLRSWAGNLRNGAYRKRVIEAADEIKRLWKLTAVSALCGNCGKRYVYFRADDPDGEIAGAKHGYGICGKDAR